MSWILPGLMVLLALISLSCAAYTHYDITKNLRETLTIAGLLLVGSVIATGFLFGFLWLWIEVLVRY